MDSHVSALVISMSYLYIVDISCSTIQSFHTSACLTPHGDNNINGNNTMVSHVYAHVTAMSFHSITDISCLWVFLTKTLSF